MNIYTVTADGCGIIGAYSSFKRALKRACEFTNIKYTETFYKAMNRNKHYALLENNEDCQYATIHQFTLNRQLTDLSKSLNCFKTVLIAMQPKAVTSPQKCRVRF